MEFTRIYVAVFVLISLFASSGCSETNAYVDYASLEAAAPDFEAGANPAYQVESLGQSAIGVEGNLEVSPSKPVAGVADSDLESNRDEVAIDPEETSQPSEAPEISEATAQAPAAGIPAAEDVDSAKQRPSDETGALDETEVAAKEPSLLGTDPMAVQKPTEPRDIKLLIPEKRFRTEGEGSVRVSYDDIDLLKILNMEPVPVDAPKHFPEWLRQLDGKRIRIRGFMYPTFEATGLKGFTLARDNGICCFVRQPMIYDIIGVDLAKGVTTDYIDNKPFDVEGVFQIEPEADDMELFQLYRITDAKVLK